MNRADNLKKIQSEVKEWDVLIIGGGATGLGCALDAASRGYKTLLLEQVDFSKGTSSRSTKLIHGGVRYLKQGDVSMVYEALHERGLLFQNAPHLVTNQSFIIPVYDWWKGPFYSLGLKVYDLMAGQLGLGSSKLLSFDETVKAIPTVERSGLKGGVIYQDGQFDDSRMAISIAQTSEDHGATVLNYCKVNRLIKKSDMVCGVIATDEESGIEMAIKAKVVINATGVFADKILKMDEPGKKDIIVPSQGIHLVLSKEYLHKDYAVMVPHTSDGRVLFAIPWLNHVVVGTTDTFRNESNLEPVALDEEVEFLLETAGKYLIKQPSRKDVLSIFAGLRPLAKPKNEIKATKEISRGQKIMVSVSGLITIIGGKWTTYRKMAEETIDKVNILGKLPEKKCVSKNLPIHGFLQDVEHHSDPLAQYGKDKEKVLEIGKKEPEWEGILSKKLNLLKSQVAWGVRKEMARTIEDVLARRTRALFLDARESLRIAPETARLMAKELKKDNKWITKQLDEFSTIAKNYYFDR